MQQLLCELAELDNGCSKGFNLPEQASAIFAVRRDDRVYVYRNQCPHLGVDLDWQPDQFLDREGTYIVCSMHGALFEIDSGYCIAGPCAGQALASLPCEVRDGRVYLLGPLVEPGSDHPLAVEPNR